MPRRARQKSESGIYHVILRGTNRQEIFHADSDRGRYLETLKRYKTDNAYNVLGWCLMSNHIHLLLQEGEMELAEIMKRTGVSYVWHYNRNYNTIGHLFQDRYKSEAVESDAYLLTVIRYIHQNPLKAGLVKRPADWKWSSCTGYYGEETYPPALLNSDMILGMFSENRSKAMAWFKEYNEAGNTDICLDDTIRLNLTDEKATAEIRKVISPLDITDIKGLAVSQRDETILKIKQIKGVTQRQAAKLIGVSPSLIFKVKKEEIK